MWILVALALAFGAVTSYGGQKITPLQVPVPVASVSELMKADDIVLARCAARSELIALAESVPVCNGSAKSPPVIKDNICYAYFDMALRWCEFKNDVAFKLADKTIEEPCPMTLPTDVNGHTHEPLITVREELAQEAVCRVLCNSTGRLCQWIRAGNDALAAPKTEPTPSAAPSKADVPIIKQDPSAAGSEVNLPKEKQDPKAGFPKMKQDTLAAASKVDLPKEKQDPKAGFPKEKQDPPAASPKVDLPIEKQDPLAAPVKSTIPENKDDPAPEPGDFEEESEDSDTDAGNESPNGAPAIPSIIELPAHRNPRPKPESNVADVNKPPAMEFEDEQDSNFFFYFLFAIAFLILGYVTFHNKSKLLGLIVEGRRSKGPRRRSGGIAYRKLDSTLEEAVSSTPPLSGPHIVY